MGNFAHSLAQAIQIGVQPSVIINAKLLNNPGVGLAAQLDLVALTE
jgi:hypothetical protein